MTKLIKRLKSGLDSMDDELGIGKSWRLSSTCVYDHIHFGGGSQ